MVDPVSDMLIRIKNAQRAGHDAVRLPYSKFKHEIAKALERAGYVGEIERRGKRVKKTLVIQLRYTLEQPAVNDVKLLSKPSQKLYTSYRDLRPSKTGGAIILSTPKGVMSRQEARKEKVGGQLIAEVW